MPRRRMEGNARTDEKMVSRTHWGKGAGGALITVPCEPHGSEHSGAVPNSTPYPHPGGHHACSLPATAAPWGWGTWARAGKGAGVSHSVPCPLWVSGRGAWVVGRRWGPAVCQTPGPPAKDPYPLPRGGGLDVVKCGKVLGWAPHGIGSPGG